jgi:hypothetical protein
MKTEDMFLINFKEARTGQLIIHKEFKESTQSA